VADVDSDGDGTPDCLDNCAEDPRKMEPGICGCGTQDNNTTGDSDRDGVPDCVELCDDDARKTDPGVCGCGIVEDSGDDDGDGVANCIDACPTDPALEPRCGCGIPDSACTEEQRLVTPVTKIVTAPGAVVRQPTGQTNERTLGRVRLTLEGFDGALTPRQLARLVAGLKLIEGVDFDVSSLGVAKPGIAAVLHKRKVSFDYRVGIRRISGKKKSVARRITSRNNITFRNLAPGEYQFRYRIRIKSGDKIVSRTPVSPPRSFVIARKLNTSAVK
jgi:hypothetical protein